jgi:hypothetical protein
MSMSKILFDAVVSFVSVFAGLFILWSAMRAMTMKQRLANAAIAGGFSAFATVIILSTTAA